MANKQETQQQPTSVRTLNKQSDIRQRYMGLGISLGVAIGAGLGVALGNLAFGIGPGIALGVAFGIILGNKHARLAQETADKEHVHDA